MYMSKLLISAILFSSSVYSFNPIFDSKSFNNIIKKSSISHSSINNNELQNIFERKVCGESLKHIANLIIDKTDKESKLIVEGSIRSNKLILKLGNIKEKEISLKNIILPIETISNKCINIRQNNIEDYSTILCFENKVSRNFWNNSITDAVLCYETQIKGKLPNHKYINKNDNIEENKEIQESNETINESHIDEQSNETNEESIEKFNEQLKKNILKEEFEDEIEQKEEQKGLKLRIAKSKYGYPKVKINGTDLNEFQKENESTNIEDNENITNLENDSIL